jgi:hypothetical protein
LHQESGRPSQNGSRQRRNLPNGGTESEAEGNLSSPAEEGSTSAGPQPDRPVQDSTGMADQNSGGTEDNDPPPRSVDPEAVRARRKAMFQGFRRVASFVFADVAGVTLRGGRTKRGGGGRARGSQGGGGQPARVRPLKSKIGLTPAMFGGKRKARARAPQAARPAAVKAAASKPNTGSAPPTISTRHCCCATDPAIGSNNASCTRCWRRWASGRDRLAEPPPSTRNLSTRPDRASRTNRNRASREASDFHMNPYPAAAK